MTAEIAIMNKEAIALATDSAVTMTGKSGQKIFASANKLFALSKYHPVGIMVYGSAIFMGVPWETIIKTYRSSLAKKQSATLKRQASDFIEFLDNGNPLFPKSVQDEYARSAIYGYFRFIEGKIRDRANSKIKEKGRISDEETRQIVSETIEKDYKEWEKTKNIPSIPKSYNKSVMNRYRSIIGKAIAEVFQDLPVSRTRSNQLRKIAGNLFSRFPEGIEREDVCGVVISGFGQKDTFPSLESFHIEGIVGNKLKYKKHISSEVSFTNSASIVPFAQRAMVDTFMEGVDPYYRGIEESYLFRIFHDYAGIVVENVKRHTDQEKKKLREKLVGIGKEILKDLREKLEEYREETHISPVTSVVSMLPKDELASMAESLVNLTSFKRKVTMERETVGGPIDVAVVSKSDGFIWIKRKHYFKAELNPQFFANRYKEV